MLTDEETSAVLEYSKLAKSNYKGNCQLLTLDNDYTDENCYIFKLNKEVLKELEDANFKMQFPIKGEGNDKAIICTNDKNFEIIESETSNSLLCVENLDIDCNKENEADFSCTEVRITASSNKIYEFKQRKASPCEIYALLYHSILNDHLDINVRNNGFKYKDLAVKVQMSMNEFTTIMKQLKVIKYNKFLYMLSPKYCCNILSKILECAIEHDMQFKCISKITVTNTLRNLFPPQIINQIFEYYFGLVDSDTSIYKVLPDEICRCFGTRILKEIQSMKLSKFKNRLQAVLPPEITPNVAAINGFGVIDDYDYRIHKGSVMIHYLNKFELSGDLEHRFIQLFNKKSHWKQDELVEYLVDVLPPEMSISGLIMKFCRCSTAIDGGKVFTKR